MADDYSNEPGFRCWLHKVLKKRDRIMNKVKSRCRKNIFKFGVEFTLTVEDTLRIDWENGNTPWHNYTWKEINNSWVGLNVLERDDHAPVGYK